MNNPDRVIDFVSNLPWSGLPRGTAAQLARDCNLTEASVSKWSRGLAAPSPNHWRAIEEVFRLRPRTIAKAAGADSATGHQRAVIATQLGAIRQMMGELQAQLERVERELLDTPEG